MSRDLYRRHRRLLRRGPRGVLVVAHAANMPEFLALQRSDIFTTDDDHNIARQVPARVGRKLNRARLRPVFLHLFRLNRKGSVFAERVRGRFEVATRLELLRVRSWRWQRPVNAEAV